MANKISQAAAEQNLKNFFGSDTEANSVSVDAIFVNTDRADKPYQTNMSWLYNKMSSMKPYNLLTTKYTVRNGTRAIDKLVLTSEGKRVLRGSAQGVSHVQATLIPPLTASDAEKDSSTRAPKVVTLQLISDIVDEFNRQNPSWEIEVVPKRVKKEVTV